MKKILLILCLILHACIIRINAQDKVTFKASAPDAVAVGDQFRLSFVVSSTDIKDFRAPTIKGFDVLMGPSRSQQSSVQIINGNTTSTRSVTFTYILLATSEGTYTIPGATITADGDEMISNSVQVKVLPADQANGISSGGVDNSASTGNSSISNSDIFVVGNVNKTTVYEQEAILLTYKIYTAIDLRGFDNVKLPDFKGFHSQEVELS
ncbi:MAG: BatD family protein, partial [Bacteroidaceae bacterium]|nr:BatD family protein [Bacteroidaceae bacterium]